jgi:TolA-binding protein
MKKLMKFVSGLLVVVLLAGVMVIALPSQTAHAAGLDGQNPPVDGKKLGFVKQRLENAFSRQQANLSKLGDRIEKLSDVSSKAQSRIDALKAKGKDTSTLETALSAFETKVPGIDAAYQAVADILSTHDGFGPNGKVIDVAAARGTVTQAHGAMVTTRQLMVSIVRDLGQAFREFRAANPPADLPTG